MGRGKLSVDGQTYTVPPPFMVIATQNPVDYEGTFPLPESQMDRFLMRMEMGYPEFEDEVEILSQGVCITTTLKQIRSFRVLRLLNYKALCARFMWRVAWWTTVRIATRASRAFRSGVVPAAHWRSGRNAVAGTGARACVRLAGGCAVDGHPLLSHDCAAQPALGPDRGATLVEACCWS